MRIRNTAITLALVVITIAAISCQNKRELPPPPDTSAVDTVIDTPLDTLDAMDVPDGDDMDVEAEPGLPVYLITLVEAQLIGPNVILFVSVMTDTGEPVEDLVDTDFYVIEDTNQLDITISQWQVAVRKWNDAAPWRTLVVLHTDQTVLEGGLLGDFIEPIRDFAHYTTAIDSRADRISVGSFDGALSLRPVVWTDDGADMAFEYTAWPNKLDTDLDRFLESECSIHSDCGEPTVERPQCVGGHCIDNTTNLHGAMIAGIDEVESQVGADERKWAPHGGALVLITDSDDVAMHTNETAMFSAVADATVPIYPIVVGDAGSTFDNPKLSSMSNAGPGHRADTLADLPAALTSVWDKIENFKQSLYVIYYCSTARADSHEVNVGLEERVAPDPDPRFISPNVISWEYTATGEALCVPEDEITACSDPDLVCGAGDEVYYCGDCAGDEVCSDDATSCQTACSGEDCAPTSPLFAIECGSCAVAEMCGSAGTCCVQDCTGLTCRTDPICGLPCAECTAPQVCNETTDSCCDQDCTGRECGPDPVCGVSCGTCAMTETCDGTGNCITS